MKAAVRDTMRKLPDDKKWMMITLEQAKQDKLKLAKEVLRPGIASLATVPVLSRECINYPLTFFHHVCEPYCEFCSDRRPRQRPWWKIKRPHPTGRKDSKP